MSLDELSITPKKTAVPCFTFSASGQRETSLIFFLPWVRARVRPEGHLSRTFGARARTRARTQHPKKFKVRPLAELVYLAQPYTYKMRIFPVQRLVRFLQ